MKNTCPQHDTHGLLFPEERADAIVSAPSVEAQSTGVTQLLGSSPLTIHSSVDANPTEQTLFTLLEAAALLRVSEKTMYRLVASREITFRRVGRGLRFSRGDLDAYLSRVRIDPIS